MQSLQPIFYELNWPFSNYAKFEQISAKIGFQRAWRRPRSRPWSTTGWRYLQTANKPGSYYEVGVNMVLLRVFIVLSPNCGI